MAEDIGTVLIGDAVRPLFKAAERFAVAEDGQDLVEYALLIAFVALAGASVWDAIVVALSASYSGYDSGVQLLWEPENPS